MNLPSLGEVICGWYFTPLGNVKVDDTKMKLFLSHPCTGFDPLMPRSASGSKTNTFYIQAAYINLSLLAYKTSPLVRDVAER
jgi:hypothetical protein